MEYKELVQKSEKELLNLLRDHREKERELRFKIASKQHKNIREIRAVKRDIARILTQINRLRINNREAVK